MFSDFLKRVICSYRKKIKFPILLVAKIGPFTVNQCAAVVFALQQERWTQHGTNGVLPCLIYLVGLLPVELALTTSPPLCCRCCHSNEDRCLKIDELILLFWI